jgi:uncharacterized protein YbjT (DUF2867 family)
MPIDPDVAMHAAARPVPRANGGQPRRLLIAGAVGRLGDALLAEALSRGGYDEVVALAEGDATMSFGVRGLVLSPLAMLPPLDSVCIAQTIDPQAPDARSFHGRDAPFAMVTRDSMLRIAEVACAAGARRLALVDPLPLWQQLSPLHLGLSNETELQIAGLPFDGVTVLRPLAQGGPAVGSWLQRIAHVYLSLQFLMVPTSMPTLTSAQVARVAIDALRTDESGIRVLGVAQIGDLLRKRADKQVKVEPTAIDQT